MASDIDWNVQSVMSSRIGVVVFLRQSVTCNIGATKYEKYRSVITSELRWNLTCPVAGIRAVYFNFVMLEPKRSWNNPKYCN